MELCQYYLEKQNTGDKTAVVMCKLEKSEKDGCWNVVAIGDIGYGRCTERYRTIQATIDKKQEEWRKTFSK